jgi:rsbT co-antagonist protein RsbR
MATETTTSEVSSFIDEFDKEILSDWVSQQLTNKNRSSGVSDASLQNSSSEFLKLLGDSLRKGGLTDTSGAEWQPLKQMLSDLSISRATLGSSPTETANFVLSLKQTIFNKLAAKKGKPSSSLEHSAWGLWTVLDNLALHTTEAFQKSREAIIRRQQKDMLEMSTPVIKLWDGVLVVPLIGTLDSARTQIVMENLLQKLIDTGSQIAILDITGVPTVDTQTAQHLLKTVSATRLMGADCIISGIRPQIAQTIVHLGIDIQDIKTKATMADAVKEALRVSGWVVTPVAEKSDSAKGMG